MSACDNQIGFALASHIANLGRGKTSSHLYGSLRNLLVGFSKELTQMFLCDVSLLIQVALSDAGVEIYPEGLLRMLRRGWQRYGLPIYVTENGVADANGSLRSAYLRSHLFAVSTAIEQGIPVHGYFHWSLMDNFEWSEGYQYRFGLYSVDFNTQIRTPGPASREFGRLSDQLSRTP